MKMNIKTISVIFIIYSVLGTNAVPRDITEFFPEAEGDFTIITWAHAVNSIEKLSTALKSKTMMLEADVVLGQLLTNNEPEDLIPIMAHPPANTSDLSLDEFVKQVQDHNINAKEGTTKKGIKLDFKTIEAFEGSIDILEKNYLQLDFPVWINADILTGPLNSPYKPVDPNRFLPLCKRFENATLSIGWKTRYGGAIRTKYTKEHMEEMYHVIQKYSIDQPITLPIRAGIAAESFVEFETLLQFLPEDTTLTLWNGGEDYINVEKLKAFVKGIGVYRIFADLPRELFE